jgi:ribosomal protein S10
MFYNRCPEFHGENANWEEFKIAFWKRFRDVHSEQYNFMKMQTVRQGKNESPQELQIGVEGLRKRL